MNHAKLKLLTIVLTIAAFTAALPCFASYADSSTTTYELPEISMTIDIPSQTSVITSTVKKNDELFKDGTFDYITAMTKMREDSAQLYGKNLKDGYEMEVISTKDVDHIKNLTKLKEKKLNKTLEKFAKQEDIVDSSIYSNGYLTFFFASRTTNGDNGRFFYADYYTVYNGNDITVRIISENDNLSQEELAVVKAAADSIKFPAKRKFSFAALQGKGVFVSFIIISVSFVLLFIYRRHDEKVNAVVFPAALKCMMFISEKFSLLKENIGSSKKTGEASESANTVSESDENESDQSDSGSVEEEDLSSIDLDAAIAFFDDSGSL